MIDSQRESDLDRLEELVSAKCNGSLSSDELAELNELISQSAELHAVYWDMITIHTDLEWELASKECSSNDGLCLFPAVETASDRPTTSRSRQTQPPVRSWWGPALAASILVILLGGWSLWNQSAEEQAEQFAESAESPTENPPVVARLTSVAPNSRWSTGRPGDRNPAGLSFGDTIRVEEGMVEIAMEGGTSGRLRASAVLQLVSENRVRLFHGHIKINAPQRADGFTVETPAAEVVDLGTVFSVEAANAGTDLVVYEGKVDLKVPSNNLVRDPEGSRSRQFSTGQAVHVDVNGTMSRIMHVRSSASPLESDKPGPSSLITSVTDNIVRDDLWSYYEIVQAGMNEDARAFVDRFHEWNGESQTGMPSYLLGADYVKVFNDDKVSQELNIEVTLSQPAVLYVLLDDRVSPPQWLTDSFSDTGDDIGVDEANYERSEDTTENKSFAELGPGKSIERTHSIWKLDVPGGGVVNLGPNGELPAHKRRNIRAHTNMYGIAAVPLAKSRESSP